MTWTEAYLHFAVCPAWNFYHHIHHRLFCVGKQRNVMEGGHSVSIGATWDIKRRLLLHVVKKYMVEHYMNIAVNALIIMQFSNIFYFINPNTPQKKSSHNCLPCSKPKSIHQNKIRKVCEIILLNVKWGQILTFDLYQ